MAKTVHYLPKYARNLRKILALSLSIVALLYSYTSIANTSIANTNTGNASITSANTENVAKTNPKVSYNKIDTKTKEISITIPINKGDFVYKDYINISADHPDIEISEWEANLEPITHFSKEFRETKKIFNQNVTLTVKTVQNTKQKTQDIKDAHIHLSYYLHSKRGMAEETIPFDMKLPNEMQEIETQVNTNVVTEKNRASGNANKKEKKKTKKSWTQYLQDLVKKTKSTWIRIVLALLLGILLSLTPCIYPMVPITVGILQAQGSKSLFSNFFLSFVYVMGIAITFAVLGLIAAFTGQIFGSILANPIFVSIVVAFMIYLALSMFGFYEIYIPRFMQTKGDSPNKKSILSIFLFGVASGSIASPCVSPGLVLLLSIVTAMGSKLLGFLLLFAFGLGLGVPLIIIGTFSGSMNKLPKAGMWMLEIKKVFGLLLFGVCFYFLNNILPWNVLLWIIAGFMMLVGIFYLYSVSKYDSPFWKFFKNLFGVSCIVLSVLAAFNAIKETYIKKPAKIINFWKQDYEKALSQAKKENKKLFIDFTTKVCSICKAIDKKVFRNKQVISTLKTHFINVKVDGTDQSKEPFATLHKKYKIFGFPTFLLIDPNTGAIIKRWSAEFYDMPNQEILALFRELYQSQQ
ncbi:protein-disulfide reductase DsbD family protein [Candidatus Dependentiae bacterium]